MEDDLAETTATSSRVIHKTGITDNTDRSYAIIDRVRSIDRTNDQYLKKTTRSSSRAPPKDRNLKETIQLGRKESINWTERGTQDSIGGVLGIVKNRSSSRARSRSRTRGEDSRDDGEKKGFLRGRSSSRTRSSSRGPAYGLKKTISRSLSRVRKAKKETRRGRSKDRQKDASKPKLPPTGPGLAKPPRKKNDFPPKPSEDNADDAEDLDGAIDKLLAGHQPAEEVEAQDQKQEEQKIEEPEQQEKEESKPDTYTLTDIDVMQLDESNSIMHVACFLNHSTDKIVELLEDEPEMAEYKNDANETPLHYASADKKGVNKSVLKQLIRLNPEAVRQPNVQNLLPIHFACMVGGPSIYVIKTFLKMYPKGVMLQSNFPLAFEDDMVNDTSDNEGDDYSEDSEFVPYRPTRVTEVSGLANMIASTASNQAVIETINDRSKRGAARFEEGSKMETGFSPLHFAIINSADPSVIDVLTRVSPRSIYLKTSRGRTALDCAQYIVRQHWLYGTDDQVEIKNTFAAIDILEQLMKE